MMPRNFDFGFGHPETGGRPVLIGCIAIVGKGTPRFTDSLALGLEDQVVEDDQAVTDSVIEPVNEPDATDANLTPTEENVITNA